MSYQRSSLYFAILLASIFVLDVADATESSELAQQVTIHRDEWGVAHVLGPTDESVIFGMGYVQGEDYYWQVEDTTLRGIGRYAEFNGEKGLRIDMMNRAFEVAPRSRTDFKRLTPQEQTLIAAYTKGLNWYLLHHPDTPRKFKEAYEPWMVLANDRHLLLDFTYRHTHASRPHDLFAKSESTFDVNAETPLAQAAREAIGSNEWAIGPSRTENNNAMLLINPHQPWYGWGQFYEVHLHSEETIQFSGACLFGTPIPSIGHNEDLGWTFTVNAPDNGDQWRVVFDKPDSPLEYRFDDGYRTAQEWVETVLVKNGTNTDSREVTFRKTHHGPLVRRENDTNYIAANVDGIFDIRRVKQMTEMVRAKNLKQFREAISVCTLPMFNIAYADRDGNILYQYNASIPKRDPQFEWVSPVDGTTSATDWKGRHHIDELPFLLNPNCGYVQNCNTSPFITTLTENPERAKYPSYMFEDADHRKRRGEVSKAILSETNHLTFDQFQNLAFDTRLYWPKRNLPHYVEEFKAYTKSNSDEAAIVKRYLDHLLDWDCISTVDSTQTTLCVAWYEELHQGTYPGETLKSEYQKDRHSHFNALVKAAKKLKSLHGDWKVPWGKVHRIARVHNQAEVTDAGVILNRFLTSLPCPGTPGPLGIIYTVYSSPSIPVVRPERYSVVGTCYVSVVEFGEKIQAASAVQFGASSDPSSKHYFDQAKLFSEKKLKPAWFYKEDVLKHAVRSYHPGSE